MESEILIYSAYEEMTYSELKNINIEMFVDDPKIKDTQALFEKNQINAILLWKENYHTKLHSILWAPYIIHYLWDISLLDRQILGVVWPRKPSQYSFKVLENMFNYAKNYELVTVSGMAEWVDQLCHAFSVKNHIPTIAILWWGILHFLQWPNRYIIDTIVQNWWLVLSEYKINFKPTKYSFPQRNRIISGLSDILFLPEAWEKSWSLITADFAYQQNKPIYVTPNDIFSTTSRWVHQLISDKKANIIVDFEKFFQENFPKKSELAQQALINLSPEEKIIIDTLHENWELDLTNLIQQTNIDATNLINHLTMLEINQYIYQNSPWIYSTIS